MDAFLVGAITLLAICLFIRETFPPDVVAVLVLGSLVVLGLITPREAVSGFSSSATIAVGAMFILSAGLRETGALDGVARLLVQVGRNGPLLLFGTMLVMAPISSLINNTAAVAVLMPVVILAARRRQIAASKILIPLSYASQFGGVCTLIGTSTNLLVNSLAVSAGLAGFGMFDFLPVGLIIVATGMLYLMTIGWWLLPNRAVSQEPGDAYAIREYICALRVPEDSHLAGKTIAQTKLGRSDNVLLELVRDGKRILPHSASVIEAGDLLIFQGAVDSLLEIARREGLWLDRAAAGVDLEGDGLQLVEVVVAPSASAQGRPFCAIDAGWVHRSTPIAIGRRGNVLHANLTIVPLQPGDAMLLLVAAEQMPALRADFDFIIVSARDNPAELRRRAPLAIAIVVAVVTVAALGWLPVEIVALLGAAAMAIGRCVSIDRLYRYVELRVLVLLAAMLPLGIAMDKTGAAAIVVQGAFDLLPAAQPIIALAVVYALTSILTEVLTNNATAVLMAPIAIATAEQLGVQPTPFLVAVAFAASTSFSTPIGYQTNIMVYSAGGYVFRDFLRVGIPLNVLFFFVSVWAIPRWFPF